MKVAGLRAPDIDSASSLIRVACGKSREVLLDRMLLTTLREHWRHHRLPGPWLFPARARKGWADHPVDLGQASAAFRDALFAAKIGRRITLHGLRHAFATSGRPRPCADPASNRGPVRRDDWGVGIDVMHTRALLGGPADTDVVAASYRDLLLASLAAFSGADPAEPLARLVAEACMPSLGRLNALGEG